VVLVLPAKVVRAIKVEVSRPCICLGASPEVANQNLNIVFELFISSKTQN
jgi:ketopantoate hydroxymethyltransferase